MKYFLMLLLTTTILTAQAQQLSLEGFLITNKGQKIIYKLFFTSNDMSRGYIISDVGGAKETKVGFLSTYNPLNKEFTFNEISVLRSNVNLYNDKLFFLVNAKLKKDIVNGKPIYKGVFDGFDVMLKQNGTTGVIEFQEIQPRIIASTASATAKNKIPNTASQTTTLPTKLKPIEDGVTNNFMPQTIVTKDEQTQFAWNSNELVLQIWDDGEYDGDKIRITLNETVVTPIIILTKMPRTYNLSLVKGVNKLKILALNNGRLYPNSAKISLADGKGKIETLLSYNEEGDTSEIDINVR